MARRKKIAEVETKVETPTVETPFIPLVNLPTVAPKVDVPRTIVGLKNEAKALDAHSAAVKTTQDREQTLVETDLTRRKLFQTISDGLTAETVLVDGDGKEVGKVPNHSVRVKYAALAADILGERISGNDSKNVNMINIYLPEQLKRARQRYQSVGAGISDLRDADGDE